MARIHVTFAEIQSESDRVVRPSGKRQSHLCQNLELGDVLLTFGSGANSRPSQWFDMRVSLEEASTPPSPNREIWSWRTSWPLATPSLTVRTWPTCHSPPFVSSINSYEALGHFWSTWAVSSPLVVRQTTA